MSNMVLKNVCGVSSCLKIVETGIQCDRCGEWYHQTCSKLIKKNFNLLKNNAGLPWICSKCVALAEECSRLLRNALHPHHSEGEFSRSVGKPMGSDRSERSNTQSTIAMSMEEPKTKVGRDAKHLLPQTAKAGHTKQMASKKKQPDSNKKTVEKQSKGPHNNSPGTAVLNERVESLEAIVRELRMDLDSVMGRARSLLIHNCAEPFTKNTRARKEDEKSRIRDILRLAGLSLTVPVVKQHRVGTWKGEGMRAPRPLLVVFQKREDRDLLLSKATKVEHETKGKVVITPDGVHPKLLVPTRESVEPKRVTSELVVHLSPISCSTPPARVANRAMESPRPSGKRKAGDTVVTKDTPTNNSTKNELKTTTTSWATIVGASPKSTMPVGRSKSVPPKKRPSNHGESRETSPLRKNSNSEPEVEDRSEVARESVAEDIISTTVIKNEGTPRVLRSRGNQK